MLPKISLAIGSFPHPGIQTQKIQHLLQKCSALVVSSDSTGLILNFHPEAIFFKAGGPKLQWLAESPAIANALVSR